MSTPFLLLTDRRSGSTLVCDTLEKRADIRLRDHPMNYWINRYYTLDVLADPVSYFRDRIFNVEGCSAAGSKFVYYWNSERYEREFFQCMRYHMSTLPKYQDIKNLSRLLADTPNLHIIRLYRRNQLERYLSYKLAVRDATWSTKQGAYRDAPITLNPHEMQRDIQLLWRDMEVTQAIFKHCPTHSLVYEDMVKDIPGTMLGIQQFLGVPDPQPLEPALKKQQKIPLSQRISNYAELKAFFKGTHMEAYFNE